jgi:hypothetical protein
MVQDRLDGLLLNIDRDLQRSLHNAVAGNKPESAGKVILLDTFVRFATNAYRGIRYLVADTPEDPARKPNYVLLVPPINRQLLDLLFTLVYMLDDFDNRSLEYQKAGWREAWDDYQKHKNEFNRNPEWNDFLSAYRAGLTKIKEVLQITGAESLNPKAIPYWKHPFELAEEPTTSRPFLRWLAKWLYRDTSAQSHLSYGGLLAIAPLLMSELVGGQNQVLAEGRFYQMYRFHQASRSAIIVLALLTEIDVYCKLGNSVATKYLWTIFSEYVPEAKEMHVARYRALLS